MHACVNCDLDIRLGSQTSPSPPLPAHTRFSFSRLAFADLLNMAAATFGALACQRDSYLRDLTTKVISCEAAAGGKGYEVVLADTVLFPEGGGQPDDAGSIAGIRVTAMKRARGTAVHVLPEPLDVGAEVKVEVDWARRLDNMMQHSAQHLLTALAITKWDVPTTSWNLGEDRSFLHLATPLKKFGADKVAELEAAANDAIVAGLPMTPRWIEKGSPELESIRCRGLPDDTVWPVRAVEIEGLDQNLCCGTHVQNLSRLQSIKVLSVEGVKQETLRLSIIAF